MSSRIRSVALLIPAWVLATGLASAQGLKVTQVDPNSGQKTNIDVTANNGPASKAPAGQTANGYFRYWDAVPLSSTDFQDVPPYLATPPNPQIGVGPDDIILIVNRQIARYPNPNSAGNCTTAGAAGCASNPYNNPPTSKQFLDFWIGITDLNTMCPTVARSNSSCVIDNASVRYDQMQGRFVVLFTVTDVPAHISNFYLVVSNWATFVQGTVNTGNLFTPPIAPIVGGTNTGGVNGNWTRYIIPVNVVLPFATENITAGGAFCTTPNLGGNPASAPPANGPGNAPGTATTGCSNYYPTGARFGLDNDNIILTAPVLDQTQAPFPNQPAGQPTGPGLPGGAYAGTRVVSVPKLYVYNGVTLPLAFNAAVPGAVNLADNTATGTLTATTGNPAPVLVLPTTAGAPAANTSNTPNTSTINPIPSIFWEPDNLRGRVFNGADSQIGPFSTPSAGVITPIDYLVGTQVTGFQTNGVGGQPGFGIFPRADLLSFFIQPIVYTCPGTSIFPGNVIFCGTASNPVAPGGSQIADLPALGVAQSTTTQFPRTNTSSVSIVSDPSTVGQSNANDGTSELQRRLFVGDSRPQQVIMREGLLYVARTVRQWDSSGNPLDSATVMYDIIKQQGPQCTIAFAGTAPNADYCTAPLGTNPYTPNGSRIANPFLVMETQWTNGQLVPCSMSPAGVLNGTGSGFPQGCDSDMFGFYAPMYDTPANVISSGPTSPIALFPWLEKLFVGMTTGDTANVSGTFPQSQPGKSHPSLWDFRPGDDAFETVLPYLDPYTGVAYSAINTNAPALACYPGYTGHPGNAFPAANNTCPMVPLTIRGGASTDPNDGSLWLYGAFARSRVSSIPGPGQWGTSVANYALDFPVTDPYGNDNSFFADVQPASSGNAAASPYFTWIQIAKNIGIAQASGTTATNCPTTGNPIIPPPPPGTTVTTTGAGLTCNLFGPNVQITRSEMARWIILAQFDPAQVTNYLRATGGVPGCTDLITLGFTCVNNPGNSHASSFADVARTDDINMPFIETLARRGVTKGCGTTTDALAAFCPTRNVTRGEMAVFIIRSKMNNVFPTTLSGIPFVTPGGQYGDNFGLFQPGTPYFTDAKKTGNVLADGVTPDLTTDSFYIYIQKMRELRISNGTGANTYSPNANITRQEVATFIVRAFFL